jgi:hypothetical protein
VHPLRIGRLQNLAWQVCHCGRQRQAVDAHADTNAYSNSYTDADTNSDAYCDTDANSDAHATAGRSCGCRIGRGFDLGLLGR